MLNAFRTGTRYQTAAVIGMFLLLAAALLLNAWVVDDAYITFRTVDNIVNGYGFTWNPNERVQAYTHPLWMLVVTFFYAITSEMFFTVIFVSFAFSMLAVLIGLVTISDEPDDRWWKAILLVIALISSKAFIDYASSGLENALSYLIAALFMFIWLPLQGSQRTVDEQKVATLFLLAALAFVNRVDTILLYLPALLWLLYLARSIPRLRLASIILLATLPASLWLGFSIVYYGYPFPNTAYAKALSTGIPLSWKIQRGLAYQFNSISWDAPSYLMLLGAVWYSLRKRGGRSFAGLSMMLGVGLYMLFTLFSAASATHMSGRFYAVPLFISLVIFAYHVRHMRLALGVSLLLAAYIAWSPLSAFKFGTSAYEVVTPNPNYIDTKQFVLTEGAALLNWRPGKSMPDHRWYHWGYELRGHPDQVHVGGFKGGPAMGYVAFAAGPEKHFIDRVGLTDPLIARMPAAQPDTLDEWQSGHPFRSIPEGYVDSVVLDRNVISDPNIQAYYELVRVITRGPIFSWERFGTIVQMNLGNYDYLVQPVSEQIGGSQ